MESLDVVYYTGMKVSTRVAITAATKAGKLLRRLVAEKQNVRVKDPEFQAHIVTQSDIRSEELIVDIIRRQFPDHAILSEESTSTVDPTKHDHLWIVDPLDGTISFAAGLPFYSVSISYFENQEPVSSALYLGATNEVIWCETGKGAFQGKRQLFVKDQPLAQAVVAVDQGVRTREITMTTIAPALSLRIRSLLVVPGEAANLGFVAKGNIQGLLCSHPRIWDYAAGIHLVLEAGGIVTDYAGKPYRWFSRAGHIACTSSVHSHILEHTKKSIELLRNVAEGGHVDEELH